MVLKDKAFVTALACVFAGTLFGQVESDLSGGGVAAVGGGGGARQVSLHIPNESAPPGGVVQMKFMVTEPTPISSGRPLFSYDTTSFDGVWGVELFSPTGDVNGVATINHSQVTVFYTSSTGAQGTDYPIMSVALHVRPDATVGSKTQFSLDPSSTWVLGLLGASSLKPVPPATVTVGGSLSITNVVPGGGTLPADSLVQVRGMGFGRNTQVQLNFKASSIGIISPQEIQIVLAEATNMTGKKIQVTNPDGSQDTYFSYLRGIPMGQSNRDLLSSAVPIFSSVAHSEAVFASITPVRHHQFTGLAVQNPNIKPAKVTITLFSSANVPLGQSNFEIPSGYRLMRETSELAQGAVASAGDYLLVSSDAPVQTFGFLADETNASFVPFAAATAR